MSTKRVAALYLALVGIPAVGVLGALKAGGGISAPASIQGSWFLHADLNANAATPCATRLSGFTTPELIVSQSGVFLEIQLPTQRRERLSGRFEDLHLAAEAPPDLFGGDVFDLLRLTAVLGEEHGEPVLRGVVGMPRRIECSPMPFTAMRRPKGKR